MPTLSWKRAAYQGYNLVIAALVISDYMNNPEASEMEYLPDFILHLLEGVAPNSFNEVAIALNAARMIDAAAFTVFPMDSRIPKMANEVDTLNHLMNFCYRMSNKG